jgi:hypothetical protein
VQVVDLPVAGCHSQVRCRILSNKITGCRWAEVCCPAELGVCVALVCSTQISHAVEHNCWKVTHVADQGTTPCSENTKMQMGLVLALQCFHHSSEACIAAALAGHMSLWVVT